MMETTKTVNGYELYMYKEAAKRNLAPKFLGARQIGDDQFDLKMEQYPYTLLEYAQNFSVAHLKDTVLRCIQRLHDEGMVHGDLHAENIVVDTTTRHPRVKLIDFSESWFVDDFSSELLEKFNEWTEPWRDGDWYEACETVDQVLDWEKEYALFDIGCEA